MCLGNIPAWEKQLSNVFTCTKVFLFLFSPELKENGFLPASSQTPLTPGPPKKKQKISYHKNNHQATHTPHRSSNNHKHSHIFFNDNHDFTAPKSNKYNKYKQQESTSNVKPWKPKRPVPTSRDPPAKLILDEADDFPRGGRKGENLKMKKKKKKKTKQAPSVPPQGHRDSRPDRLWTGTGEMQGSESKQEKGKKKRMRRSLSRRTADKKLAAQMYPTDENLFIIKQRKRSR